MSTGGPNLFTLVMSNIYHILIVNIRLLSKLKSRASACARACILLPICVLSLLPHFGHCRDQRRQPLSVQQPRMKRSEATWNVG